MSTKGRNSSMKDKRGRSPSLPKKPETPSVVSVIERKKGLTPMGSTRVSNQFKPSITSNLGTPAQANSKKKEPFVDKTKQPPNKRVSPSKVTSTIKSKPNSKINVTRSTTTVSLLIKPKDVGKVPRIPLKSLKNSFGVKETSKKQTSSQPTMGFESKVMVVENKSISMSETRSLFEADHDIDESIIVCHEEDDKSNVVPIARNGVLILEEDPDEKHLDDKGNNDLLHDQVQFEEVIKIPRCDEPSDHVDLREDQDMLEYDHVCCKNNETIDNEPTNEDHDDNINLHDQTDEENVRIHLISRHIVDQENRIQLENERVAKEADDLGSKPLEEPEHKETNYPKEPEEHEETKPNEPEQEQDKLQEEANLDELEHEEEPNDEDIKPTEIEIKEDGAEVPKAKESTSKVEVNNQQEVVVHGKKDTSAYNDVIEKTVSKLREQRKNKVKALVGAFETVISLESNTLPQ